MTTFSWRFVTIAGFFVTALVVSNIIAVKLAEVGGRVFDAGNLLFPLAYVLGDVLTEVYGFRAARRVILLGFACNVLAVAAIQLAIRLPPADFWAGNEEAYEAVLGTTWRIFVASLCAYLVGELTNSYVLSRMKVVTGGRYLWSRTIGSSLVGQALDSTIFVTIAFAGTGAPLDRHQSIPGCHPENPLCQLPAAPSTGRQLGKGPITDAVLQDLISKDSENRQFRYREAGRHRRR